MERVKRRRTTKMARLAPAGVAPPATPTPLRRSFPRAHIRSLANSLRVGSHPQSSPNR